MKFLWELETPSQAQCLFASAGQFTEVPLAHEVWVVEFKGLTDPASLVLISNRQYSIQQQMDIAYYDFQPWYVQERTDQMIAEDNDLNVPF